MKKIAFYRTSVSLKNHIIGCAKNPAYYFSSNVHLFTKLTTKGLFRGGGVNKSPLGKRIELVKPAEKKRFCLISLI